MTIKLDWELEAERGVVQRGGEDPDSKRRRRVGQFRFFLVVLIFILAGAAVVGVVALRLREVDQAIERQLRASVEAEVTALRLGDRQAFLNAQWQAQDNPSVTANWVARQGDVFNLYQSLKQSHDVNLTGQVLDVVIDGQNGRVRVQEIIDGVPYAHLWFYWRFEEGWLHVPTAYGFWGDSRQIDRDHFSVVYRDVDTPVAEAMANELPRWFDVTCAIFDCGTFPHMTVEIVADDTLVAGWSADDPWRLRVPSPYIVRARVDQPFDPSLRFSIAGLWVDKLDQFVSAQYPADSAFFRDAVRSYLVEQYTQIDTSSYLIKSLVNAYGIDTLRRLFTVMSPQATASVLTLVTGEPLESIRVDWRDFLAFRLRTEADLNAQRAETAYYGLYDSTDPNVMALAASRFAAGATSAPSDSFEVLSAAPERAADGTPQLRAVVSVNGSSQTSDILFKLIDGNWKRAS